MVQFACFVKDVATRTRHNLEKIEAQSAAGFDVYEVTQLINSLLGMVVFIQQKEKLPAIHLSKIAGFPKVEFLKGNEETEQLASFIKHFRNALAHGRVEAKAEGTGDDISHLELSDKHHCEAPVNWRVKCRIEDVRWIAIYLTKLITDES